MMIIRDAFSVVDPDNAPFIILRPSAAREKVKVGIGNHTLWWTVEAILELRKCLLALKVGSPFVESLFRDGRNRPIRAYRPLAHTVVRIEFGRSAFYVTDRDVDEFLQDDAFALMPPFNTTGDAVSPST